MSFIVKIKEEVLDTWSQSLFKSDKTPNSKPTPDKLRKIRKPPEDKENGERRMCEKYHPLKFCNFKRNFQENF